MVQECQYAMFYIQDDSDSALFLLRTEETSSIHVVSDFLSLYTAQ